MAVVQRKLARGKVVYWVTFQWQGEPVWKRIKGDKAEARRLDTLWRKQRKDGTYRDEAPSEFVKVGSWIDRFLEARVNRSAGTDRQQQRDHVLTRAWFTRLRVIDVTPLDIERVVKEIRADRKLGEKSIANLFSVLQGAFKRAVFEGIRSTNPCATLPPGTVKRGTSKKREPYARQEARRLMQAPHPELMRVFLLMAFYTGMRLGELAGRRFRDWGRAGTPLGALRVDTQYNDQPLKTDDEELVHPRYIPVHPELALALEQWWASGFELHLRRPPTDDDFILPTLAGEWHARNSLYTKFQAALERAKVPNRTVHATRHTFATVCRAGTGRHDVVERITHNAKGTQLDEYTHPEWEAMCEVISGTDYTLDRATGPLSFFGNGSGLSAKSAGHEVAENSGNSPGSVATQSPSKPLEKPVAAAVIDASQDTGDRGWLGRFGPPAAAADFTFLQSDLGGTAP